MAIFLSSFENKVDKKGRVSVPASFRQALSQEAFQGIVLFRSYKSDTLEGCGLSRMERLSDSIDEMEQFSEDQDDLLATIFADAHQLAFDADGRVMLPKALMEHAKVTDRVMFVGRGGTFQIWNPSDFAIHQEQARSRAREKKMTLRLKPSREGGHND